jgi:hypothetical protein
VDALEKHARDGAKRVLIIGVSPAAEKTIRDIVE